MAEYDNTSTSSTTADIPNNLRHLRACLTCRLIKSTEQWHNSNGICDNCGDYGDIDLSEYTTPVFKGMISLMQPTGSWVNRFQRGGNIVLQSQGNQIKQFVQGLYAVQVSNTTGSSGAGAGAQDEAIEEEDQYENEEEL